jgi:hypothetical protein
MTRYANFDALRRSISPDVQIMDNDAQRPAIVTPPATPSEHDEQVALFAWAAVNEAVHPELANMFAIPNGGHRHLAVAAMLKQEGVRAGVPDCFLAVRRGQWGGLFLELKRADRTNHATPAQEQWSERLRAAGYLVVICYGADDAITAIQTYLREEQR